MNGTTPLLEVSLFLTLYITYSNSTLEDTYWPHSQIPSRQMCVARSILSPLY